jgi:2,4-didehydro-3-deoxy-L-rhamnonate hydrolase
MRLARIRTADGVCPIARRDGRTYDLSPRTPDLSPGLDPETLSGWLDAGDLPVIDDVDLDFAPPVARAGAVIAIGLNYAAHAAESDAAPPTYPVMFLKTPNTIAGPNDDVEIPPHSHKTDWEVELAMIIGRRAYLLDSPDVAFDYVAGFTIANDLSERAFQLEESGGQWSKGKCLPGYSPLGPWLVSPDELEVSDLRLRSFVNDEPRQDSTTADMIFSPAVIIHHLSQYLALEPGDVVLTGTPEGVALSGRFPYLTSGDVVRLEIDGLGEQRQRMVAGVVRER